MMINPAAPCADCGKPIDNGYWYYGKGRPGGKDGYHHSTCGDRYGIEAAIATEREHCANKAREFATHYPEASDGRNTFIILAEWIEAGKR